MAATTATLNGKPQQRRQLADQLDRFDKMSDRLDTIIDALAEALPGAVRDACKEGAREAVREAIIEIVTNPDLRSLLVSMQPHSAPSIILPAQQEIPPPPPTPRKPNHWDRLKTRIAAMTDSVRTNVNRVRNGVTGRWNAIRQTMTAISLAAGEQIPLRQIFLTALCVGLVVGSTCLVLPQEVAAVVSGLSAATTAIGVQIGCWLKKAARRFGLMS